MLRVADRLVRIIRFGMVRRSAWVSVACGALLMGRYANVGLRALAEFVCTFTAIGFYGAAPIVSVACTPAPLATAPRCFAHVSIRWMPQRGQKWKSVICSN